MSKTYLITLTPTGKFFFGGDMTFSVGNKETQFTSYFVKSNKFPQQTSLLGMLRFLLLRNSNKIFDTSTQTIFKDKIIDAERLIGPRSFSYTGKINDFGAIKKIHPCSIQVKMSDKWFWLEKSPKDEELNINCSKITPAVINGKNIDIPQMKYDPKKVYETEYTVLTDKSNSTTPPIKEHEIFTQDICNGIDRDIETGAVEDNAYFKQVFYRFNNTTDKEYRFALYAEVDFDSLTDYNSQIVSIGGDNSQFVIGITEANIPMNEECTGKRLTLLSPAFLSKEDLRSVSYAVTETIPFKCMKTTTETAKSYNKRNQLYGYTEGLNLYASGSVFYFKTHTDANDFAKKLKESHADFYQIGYNHYRITNK